MMKSAWLFTAAMAVLATAALAGFGFSRVAPSASQAKPEHGAQAPPARIPAGPAGARIRLGQEIFEQTPHYAAAYVGNQMNCKDCHLSGGRAEYAAPLVGIPGLFPAYNKRAGRVITLAERIQECFVRSENGKPPAANSATMKALLAYFEWISKGQPKGKPYPGRGLVKLPALKGDPGRGAGIYAKQCSICHGNTGTGMPPVLPPLWGATSFNDGAGMARVAKMAAFVQRNMPQNAPGTLSPQQAYDVAAYVNSQPRPKMNPAYSKY